MKWFDGNIAEAVQKAQIEGAIFGVVILGILIFNSSF